MITHDSDYYNSLLSYHKISLFEFSLSLTILLLQSTKCIFSEHHDKSRISRICIWKTERSILYTVAAGVKFEVESLWFSSRFPHSHVQFWENIKYIRSFSSWVTMHIPLYDMVYSEGWKGRFIDVTKHFLPWILNIVYLSNRKYCNKCLSWKNVNNGLQS